MKIKCFVLIALQFYPFVQESFSQGKFILEGFLSGYEDGTKIMIGPTLPNMAADRDQDKEITLKEGMFTFEMTLHEPTRFSLRVLPKIPPDNPADFEFITFWAESKRMTLNGKKGNLYHAKVSGSEIQDEYEKFVDVGRLKWQKNKEIKDSVLTYKLAEEARIPLRKLVSENIAIIEREQLKFIYGHPDYLSCVAELVYFINFSPHKISKIDVVEFYKSLGYDFKNNEYGIQIRTFISGIALETNRLGIGDKPFKFTLPDSSGNSIQLNSFDGKLVLIDFWASGCGPCRLEHKNYLKAYKKYQSKGFEILSVSQDQSKKQWTKAIQVDNMIWMSVWDTNREVTKMYQVFAIPANYLVSDDGVIIGQDMRFSELSEVLEKILMTK